MASYSGSRSQRLDLYNPADWIESSDAEDSSSESWEHSETVVILSASPGGETAASWNAREVAGIDDDGGSSGEEDGASSTAVAVRGKEGSSSRTEILSWNSHQAELRERVSAVRLRYLRSASRQVAEMLGAVGDSDGQFSACVWFGAVAVHSHMPESDVEVQISRGDIVLVMSYEDDDWWYGRVLNRQGSTAEGWLPPSHLDAVDGILTALSVVQQLQHGVQQEQLSPPETAIEPSPSRRLRRSITELNSGLQQKLASQAMHDYGNRTPLANSLRILVSKCRYKVVILAHRITKGLSWLGMVEPVLVRQVAGLLWLGMVEPVLVRQVAGLLWLGMVEPALVRQVAGLLWLGMVEPALVRQVAGLLWRGMVEPVLVRQVAGLLWLGMVELVLVRQVAGLLWLGMVELVLVEQDQVAALVNLLSTRVRPTPHTTLQCSLGRLELRQGN